MLFVIELFLKKTLEVSIFSWYNIYQGSNTQILIQTNKERAKPMKISDLKIAELRLLLKKSKNRGVILSAGKAILEHAECSYGDLRNMLYSRSHEELALAAFKSIVHRLPYGEVGRVAMQTTHTSVGLHALDKLVEAKEILGDTFVSSILPILWGGVNEEVSMKAGKILPPFKEIPTSALEKCRENGRKEVRIKAQTTLLSRKTDISLPFWLSLHGETPKIQTKGALLSIKQGLSGSWLVSLCLKHKSRAVRQKALKDLIRKRLSSTYLLDIVVGTTVKSLQNKAANALLTDKSYNTQPDVLLRLSRLFTSDSIALKAATLLSKHESTNFDLLYNVYTEGSTKVKAFVKKIFLKNDYYKFAFKMMQK